MATVKSDETRAAASETPAAAPVVTAAAPPIGGTLITAEGFTLLVSDATPSGEILDVTYDIDGVLVTRPVFEQATQVKMLALLRLLIP